MSGFQVSYFCVWLLSFLLSSSELWNKFKPHYHYSFHTFVSLRLCLPYHSPVSLSVSVFGSFSILQIFIFSLSLFIRLPEKLSSSPHPLSLHHPIPLSLNIVVLHFETFFFSFFYFEVPSFLPVSLFCSAAHSDVMTCLSLLVVSFCLSALRYCSNCKQTL